MDLVRIGIIGVGGMGTSHSRYLKAKKVDRCELVAVCDIDPAKLEKFAEFKTYTDSKELIRSGEVDAVIIATPHYGHTTVGIDAFEQGLHVLTEKPISVHKADCERLIAAHQKRPELVFSAMFQMRTDPYWQRVKKLIDDGELGEIRRTNWVVTAWYRTQAYYNSGGWRATWKGEGGGVLLNQCPHNLDLFQWMCGLPVRMHAVCNMNRYHDIEVEDDMTAYFEYANGATGVFIASTGEAPGTDRLEIVGDRGKVICEDGKIKFSRTVIPVSEHLQTATGGFDRPETWEIEVPVSDAEKGHYMITRNFVDAILDGAELIAPAEDGINSVEFANAMLYSSWTGQTVDLPLDGATYEDALKQQIAESKFEKKDATESDADISNSFR
jgi:predicted dehydrogenase